MFQMTRSSAQRQSLTGKWRTRSDIAPTGIIATGHCNDRHDAGSVVRHRLICAGLIWIKAESFCLVGMAKALAIEATNESSAPLIEGGTSESHYSGSAVFNLHHGLLFLIMNQPGISDNDRRSLKKQLAADVADDTFGLATQRIVKVWQEQLNSNPDLPQNLQGLVLNDVDPKTAGALNWLLGTLGAFPVRRATVAGARPPRIKPKKKASNIRRKPAKRRKPSK
jgi:hypothetical protein